MNSNRLSVLLLALLVTAGCSDFATAPDRTPTELRVTPQSVLLTEGDTARFQVEVLDQNGEPYASIPSWSPPFWTSQHEDRLVLDDEGVATAVGGGATRTEVSLAGLETRAVVRVNPAEMGLEVPFLYVAQSVQRQNGDVPLIAGRDGLLRVYVQGDELNFYRPSVRATFHNGGSVVHTATMDFEAEGIPTTVREGDQTLSYDAEIPGSVLLQGTSVVIEVDPNGAVPSTPESTVRVPATGTLDLGVRTVPPMQIRLVPVNHSGLHSSFSDATADAATRLTADIFPLGDVDVDVRADYTTEADLSRASGWEDLIFEMVALRQDDGSPRYYYGGFQRPAGTNFLGLGFVGYPVSIGVDHQDATLAHEVGHNFGLLHAPCGGPASTDPDYPYANAIVGQYGWDPETRDFKDRELHDLMSYCSPIWISDFHYEKVVEYRDTSSFDAAFQTAAAVAERQRTLLVGGSISDGELRLQPALELDGPVTLPRAGGRYTLEGLDAEGGSIFSLSLEPKRLDHGDRAFFFVALPAEMADVDRLDRIRLSGPEGVAERSRSGPPTRQAPEVRLDRTAAQGTATGRSAVRWDRNAFPMAVVRERDTGLIRAISRTGRIALPDDDPAAFEVLLSDGAATHPARVVQP